ncbi:MAG: hypothetical protein WA485_23810 [Candidatus Sulfotelmatobacter sp.]
MTTGLQNVINGPNRTSPSSIAFTSDPSMGPYPTATVPTVPASIATLGPPVSTLPNPEVMQYTNATTGTIATVYANEQAGNCPNLGPSASVNAGEYITPVLAPEWVGGSLISNAGADGEGWGGPEAPSPTPSSNQTLGEMSTEQYMMKLGVDGPQQGSNALNAVVSFSGIDPSTVQTFRWE